MRSLRCLEDRFAAGGEIMFHWVCARSSALQVDKIGHFLYQVASGYCHVRV